MVDDAFMANLEQSYTTAGTFIVDPTVKAKIAAQRNKQAAWAKETARTPS